jgi:hypothetical protein
LSGVIHLHQEYNTLVVFPGPPFYYSINMDLPPRYDSVFDGPATYQITVQGMIASGWSRRLEGMAISHIALEDGTLLTILTGEVTDQAALSGVLNTIYELHLALLTVNKLPFVGLRQEGSPPEG